MPKCSESETRRWLLYKGHVSGTSDKLIAHPAATNLQTRTSDWKATAKNGLEVASRFSQTLLKKIPECANTNPVKMALAIAKVIVEIKDVDL